MVPSGSFLNYNIFALKKANTGKKDNNRVTLNLSEGLLKQLIKGKLIYA